MEEVLPHYDIICRVKLKTVLSGLLYALFFLTRGVFFPPYFFFLCIMNINDTTQPGLFFCPHVDQTSPSVSSTCVTPTCSKSTSVCVCPPPWTSHSPVTAVIYGLCARKQAWWAHYSYVRASLADVWRQKPKGLCAVRLQRDWERESVCACEWEREREPTAASHRPSQRSWLNKMVETDRLTSKVDMMSVERLSFAASGPFWGLPSPHWCLVKALFDWPHWDLLTRLWGENVLNHQSAAWNEQISTTVVFRSIYRKKTKVKINRKQLFQRSIRDRKSRQISLGSQRSEVTPQRLSETMKWFSSLEANIFQLTDKNMSAAGWWVDD